MPTFTIINPPSPFLIDDRAFLSLGPIQIATMARDVAGWDAKVLDLTGHLRRCDKGDVLSHAGPECEEETWAYCKQAIQAAAPSDLWGFYSMSCHLAVNVRLLGLVREAQPGAVCVIGGPHASLDPGGCLALGFDHAVVAQTGGGGGEAPTKELLDLLRVGELHGQGRWSVLNGRGRGPANDADAWPFADRRLIDHEDYHYYLGGIRAASIVTQYGCPYGCDFCSHGPGYRSLRFRSEDCISAELAHLDALGYQAVMLYDDEVNVNARHFEMLCRVLGERGFTWRAFIKANLFTEAQAKLAAESGCIALCTGVEAADEVTLKAIGKAATREDNTRFVKLCREAGVAAKCFSMVGLPTQTKQACYELRDWLLEMVAEYGLREYDVTVYTPYPGTPYFDRPGAFGLKWRGGQAPDYAKETVHYKGLPGEYVGRVDTSWMRAEDIVAVRDEVDVAVRREVERLRRGEGHRLAAEDDRMARVYAAQVVDGG